MLHSLHFIYYTPSIVSSIASIYPLRLSVIPSIILFLLHFTHYALSITPYSLHFINLSSLSNLCHHPIFVSVLSLFFISPFYCSSSVQFYRYNHLFYLCFTIFYLCFTYVLPMYGFVPAPQTTSTL